ncbi:MgtC/SapB family protein [Brevibacillus sp. B_LB10_24]|uniref:MgtC/SapB family protein n=1 Tax=Brevibacillus sp. B_LB10_24 TaxID=3380645 RepID=UPI0038B836D6
MEFNFLLRMVVAGLCGAFIGFERKNRMKEAGIRTHFVVALGLALMMIISKYGFQDQIGWSNLGLDPSRIAAQVVSGVGFLGAGMIFMQRQTVKGLTTAAGIWATAGIGMAIGAGMYWVGAGTTVFVLFAQKLLHGRFHWLAAPKSDQMTIRFDNEPGNINQILERLKEKNITILSFHAENDANDPSEIILEIFIKIPGAVTIEQLLPIIQELSSVRSVEVG